MSSVIPFPRRATLDRLGKLGGDALTVLGRLERIRTDCDYRERTSSTSDPWLRELVARLDACVEDADHVARGLSDLVAPYDAPTADPSEFLPPGHA